MLKVQKWKEKRTHAILKTSRKPTQKSMIKTMLTQGVFWKKKKKAKTKYIAIFIWTPSLQTLVLEGPSLVPLPCNRAGSLWWLQDGAGRDVKTPLVLCFCLFSPFSPVTGSSALRGIVSHSKPLQCRRS